MQEDFQDYTIEPDHRSCSGYELVGSHDSQADLAVALDFVDLTRFECKFT